ncbi:hypothetical protein Lal_00043236 [Lupinus albus]|nr:hypothetical protein Lal_00043236 [Lupinus albus]
MVHNTQDAMLHNSRIPPNYVRVTIDIEIEDNALLPIPLDVDIITLGGAICTFVAWPVHLVDVVPTKGMVIDEHSATTPTKVEHASKKTKVVKSKRKENKSRSKSSNKESSGESRLSEKGSPGRVKSWTILEDCCPSESCLAWARNDNIGLNTQCNRLHGPCNRLHVDI